MELKVYREGSEEPELIELHPLADISLRYSLGAGWTEIPLNDTANEQGRVVKLELGGDREPPPPPDPIEYYEHEVKLGDFSPYAKEPDKVLTTLRLRK